MIVILALSNSTAARITSYVNTTGKRIAGRARSARLFIFERFIITPYTKTNEVFIESIIVFTPCAFIAALNHQYYFFVEKEEKLRKSKNISNGDYHHFHRSGLYFVFLEVAALLTLLSTSEH
jgi:hypothetical protein